MAKHARQLLTDLAVRKARRKTKAYRLFDGGGLCLCILPSGARSWQYRYRLDGKPQTATLGRLEDVTLVEAREKASEARKLAGEGKHVTTEKRLAKAKNRAKAAATFKAVAARWVERQAKRKNWTDDYKAEVEASLCNHLSKLDLLPLADISAALVSPIIERVERKAPDMARKVEQRLQGIMDYGVRRGLIPVNPLPRPDAEKKDRKHFPAILEREGIGAILRDAEQLPMVSTGVRRAHLLTVFTAQRIGEIAPAEWSEFALDGVDVPVEDTGRMKFDPTKGNWTIPRARMKRKDEQRGPHIVPIPPKLLAMMREWRRGDGTGATYVCPAPNREGPITREAVEKLYRRGLGLSGKHSPHSWRSVLKSWSEDAGKDTDEIEAQLDHVVGNKVAASYDRAKRLNLRRALMTWYEAQLIAARDGAEVVPFKRAGAK